MAIHGVVDEGLGHSSYVVGVDDDSALVIDPPRFADPHRRIAAEHGWTIAWTADTHSHADYISGGTELAAGGATFLASRAAGLEVPHVAVDGGDVVELGSGVELRAIATPGHTPDHLAYLLAVRGEPVALFSGGSLMVGAVGRTDLLGDDRREDLAHALFRALRTEILTLPDELPVYPTHGAGSFCSAPGSVARTTTIGTERATNPLLRIVDEDEFVSASVTRLGTFPEYFLQLPEINRRGPRIYPRVPDLSRLDLQTFERALAEGAALVDARPIDAYSRAHAPGSLSIQLRPVFASWLGWLVPLDRPVVFILDDETDREELVRQCLVIGHDNVLGELAGGLAAWVTAGRPVSAVPLVGPGDVTGSLVDIRQTSEWAAGHVPGATHVELGSLAASVVPGGPLTLMCGHGERAMTGASILESAGRDEIMVLAGGPEEWSTATGVALESV